MYICTQILMWPLEKGQIAKSAALLWHSCFFQKPGDVTLSFSLVDYFRKTSLSFGFSMERKHQRAHGIIHHRLVVDGQELLAHPLCDGVQPRAGASG